MLYLRSNHFFAFGLRWGQPGQQHGRRFPSVSSADALSTCCFLVSGFLTKVTQQIHSLRARGVRPFHASRAFGEETSAFRKSAGTLCTTPVAISFLPIKLFLEIAYLYFCKWQAAPRPTLLSLQRWFSEPVVLEEVDEHRARRHSHYSHQYVEAVGVLRERQVRYVHAVNACD